MVKVSINTRMVESMRDNFNLTKNMAMVYIYGKMVESMKEIGRMVNNRVKEFIMNN